MTEHLTTDRVTPGDQGMPISPMAWARANALGLGLAFGSFALVGGSIEAAGADHDSLLRNLPAVVAMVAAGTVFALLRRRALGARLAGPAWRAPVIGVGLAAGFVAGLVAPFDFILGILAAGTVGGVLQLRSLRRQLGDSRRLLLTGIGAWLVAGLAAVATAVLTIDVFLVGVLGVDPDAGGVAPFAGIFALLGLIGGAVGGGLEGATLSRRIRRSQTRPRPS
jgi:hypothetical protein